MSCEKVCVLGSVGASVRVNTHLIQPVFSLYRVCLGGIVHLREFMSIYTSYLKGLVCRTCACVCVCVLMGREHTPPLPVSIRSSVSGGVSGPQHQWVVQSSSWWQRWCMCVSTSWCAALFVRGRGHPSLPPLHPGLRFMAAVGSSSSSKHPAQPPWISMLFPEGDFPPPHPPPALPPRPQCLSPPGPRCSKLIPAQSFIDFKIEANSGLKKKKERETGRPEKESETQGDGGGPLEMGPDQNERQRKTGTVKDIGQRERWKRGRGRQRQRKRQRLAEQTMEAERVIKTETRAQKCGCQEGQAGPF